MLLPPGTPGWPRRTSRSVRFGIYAASAIIALGACSSPAPYATTIGILKPGQTITVNVTQGDVNADRPAKGEPATRFTISATAEAGQESGPPTVRPAKGGIVVTAASPLESLLVRVPDGVHLVVNDRKGNVRVTDVTGRVDVVNGDGDVTIVVPGVAQASTQSGRVSATFGATQWPGTLRFSSQRGDVDVYVRADASFRAFLHTGNGRLFSDFGLHGRSQGTAQTIDAPVNGGGTQGVDVQTQSGVARLLRGG
jgi:hypothetical protein